MPDLLGWVAGHRPILVRTLGEHLALSLAALALAVAVAIPLALLLARWPRAATPVLALVNTLRAVPSLALLVLMLPVFGTGFVPSLLALVLYGLPAILINTHTGLAEVDRDIVEAARGQGLSEGQVLRGVTIPLALPVIFAGLRSAAVQIVSAATLAVFIGGGGLGELISAGMGLLDIPQLLVGAIAVALLAIMTEIVFGAVERAFAYREAGSP
jgi:osmoprotectant transport system permease protein